MLEDKYLEINQLALRILKEYKDRYKPFVFFSSIAIIVIMVLITLFFKDISFNVDRHVFDKNVGAISSMLYSLFMVFAFAGLIVLNYALLKEDAIFFKVKYTEEEKIELNSAIRLLDIKKLDELFVLLEKDVDRNKSHYEQLRYNLLREVYYDRVENMLYQNPDYEPKSRFFNLGF